MKSLLDNISGLLIDLDGVVYISNQAIPGAAEAITRLKTKNIPLRFVTNTTTMSQDSLHKKMVALGLPIEKHEIISAVQAAVLYLRSLKNPTCYLVLTEDCKKDFAEFIQTDKNPDYIIIGDLQVPRSISGVRRPRLTPAKKSPTVGRGRPTAQSSIPPLEGGTEGGWTYPLLNKIFNMLITGSKMIALHKGKFWQTDQGLTLDIGVFVAGFEYVTGQTATVIGKPSKTFFELALKDFGVPASRAAMISDDLDNDIAGAKSADIAKTILVKTGKYREELVKKSKVKPDAVVEGIETIN